MQRAAEIKQDDLNVLVSIAQLHFEFKKLKEAEDAIDKVLEKDNGHLSANFLKGRLYLLKKDFANALSRFDLIVKESPRNAMAHYFKALSLVGKGENMLAEQDLLKAVELNPRLLDARLLLAEFYLRQRNQDLAREQIESSLKLAPKNIRALMLHGNQKILERDTKGAEAVFKEITKLDPDFAPAYVRLGLVYNLTKRPEDAQKSFQKALELDPQQTDALTLIVGTYVREKKYDKAFQICEKQKEKTGGNTSHLALIQYLEGNISLAGMDPEKARHHFENAIKTDPNIIAPYVALARIYIMEKKLDQAISQYEAILSKNPKYLAAYMALGTIYDQQGDGEKAETYYRKALEIKSDFAPAANNLAWNLAERGGNIDEALGFAQVAKEQMPGNGAVMDTLGWIYYLKGSYLNAIAEFQDSLTQNPDNPVINLHLGLAYYKNKQPRKAKEFLDKALNINQNFKGAEEARNILKEIETSASAG
jgi:tetratricopeptide (TPR) repeat protein